MNQRALSDDLVRFVQTHLRTVWALKMMIVMHAAPNDSWTAPALVKELRASEPLVNELLARFERLGLIIQVEEKGIWCWRPATDEVRELADAIAVAYATTPFGVIQAIAEAPEDRIRQFADAFRVRRD